MISNVYTLQFYLIKRPLIQHAKYMYVNTATYIYPSDFRHYSILLNKLLISNNSN